jgi:hypothetical protein
VSGQRGTRPAKLLDTLADPERSFVRGLRSGPGPARLPAGLTPREGLLLRTLAITARERAAAPEAVLALLPPALRPRTVEAFAEAIEALAGKLAGCGTIESGPGGVRLADPACAVLVDNADLGFVAAGGVRLVVVWPYLSAFVRGPAGAQPPARLEPPLPVLRALSALLGARGAPISGRVLMDVAGDRDAARVMARVQALGLPVVREHASFRLAGRREDVSDVALALDRTRGHAWAHGLYVATVSKVELAVLERLTASAGASVHTTELRAVLGRLSGRPPRVADVLRSIRRKFDASTAGRLIGSAAGRSDGRGPYHIAMPVHYLED